jgi:hypothetical protein
MVLLRVQVKAAEGTALPPSWRDRYAPLKVA